MACVIVACLTSSNDWGILSLVAYSILFWYVLTVPKSPPLHISEDNSRPLTFRRPYRSNIGPWASALIRVSWCSQATRCSSDISAFWSYKSGSFISCSGRTHSNRYPLLLGNRYWVRSSCPSRAGTPTKLPSWGKNQEGYACSSRGGQQATSW